MYGRRLRDAEGRLANLEAERDNLRRVQNYNFKYYQECHQYGCRTLVNAEPNYAIATSFMGMTHNPPAGLSLAGGKFYCSAHFSDAKEKADLVEWAREHPEEARVCKEKGDKVREEE